MTVSGATATAPAGSAQGTTGSGITYSIPDGLTVHVPTGGQKWDVTITETGADLSKPGGCAWQTIVEGLTLSGGYTSAYLGFFAHTPAPLNDPTISFYGTTTGNVGIWRVRYRFTCSGGSTFTSGGQVFYVVINAPSHGTTTTAAPPAPPTTVRPVPPTTTTTTVPLHCECAKLSIEAGTPHIRWQPDEAYRGGTPGDWRLILPVTWILSCTNGKSLLGHFCYEVLPRRVRLGPHEGAFGAGRHQRN